MIDFRIIKVHDTLVAVHLEYEDAVKIRTFDSLDEAYRFLLNNEELISFWR
jgi:hypothetical protein